MADGRLTRRSVWRVKRTTILVALCTAALLAVLNLAPGNVRLVSHLRYGDIHGWPYEFLNRTSSGSWLGTGSGHVLEFQARNLALDVLVALTISAATGAVYEYRARGMRRKPWQFTVNEPGLRCLTWTDFTPDDEALRALQGLRQLRQLSLDCGALHDDSLVFFESLEDLQSLTLQNARHIGSGAVGRLRERLPRCIISTY
ncbi:MAG TPA: hypothetical protein VHC22_27535 [Pirellulales bacterium]|nr:hypothetical protein [Pirellulales bacterium]